ncbi:hypothetical protein GCM10022248_00570 [Nonomuraea soli]
MPFTRRPEHPEATVAFSQRDAGGVTISSLSGELDAAREPALRAAVEEVLTRPDGRLVIGLASATFTDSLSLRPRPTSSARPSTESGECASSAAIRWPATRKAVTSGRSWTRSTHWPPSPESSGVGGVRGKHVISIG